MWKDSMQTLYVEGFKTDPKDARWLAGLLEILVRGSFIHSREIRDLRDMTRYRRRLIEERTAEVNRVQKILEDANIKLACVATDIFGVSGRAILNALLEGEMAPEEMAELSKGRLRNKREQLAESLEGIANSDDCLLVIDQLDAVSLTYGRNTQFLDCVHEITQALGYQNMRVLLACRHFDLENDHRLRSLVMKSGMSLEKIGSIIEAIRFERYRWTPVRRTYIAKKNGKRRPLGFAYGRQATL